MPSNCIKYLTITSSIANSHCDSEGQLKDLFDFTVAVLEELHDETVRGLCKKLLQGKSHNHNELEDNGDCGFELTKTGELITGFRVSFAFCLENFKNGKSETRTDQNIIRDIGRLVLSAGGSAFLDRFGKRENLNIAITPTLGATKLEKPTEPQKSKPSNNH